MNSQMPREEHLLRYVKMTFAPDKIAAFRDIFEVSKDKIKEQEGCLHLELLEDVRYPNIMMTFSIWASLEDLDAYRDSALFRDTWARTKVLFAARPEASSFRRIPD